jgi:hypothetical protein
MSLEIRASGLARPMACAGSLFFTDLPEQEESAPAMEGTAFGEYCQRLVEMKPIGSHAENGVAFTDDMKFYAMPYIKSILDLADGEIFCETRIDWVTRSGIKIRGSYDHSFTVGNTLYIDDNKYGWGIVEVKRNWQLIAYAIGEVIRRQTVFEKIVMRIHQPRPHHEDGDLREWSVSYEELLALKEEIEVRMQAIADGERSLTTNDKCRYCPAAARHCPAISKALYRGVEVAHEFTQDNIDERELSFQLDLVARASEILKIKTESLTALAVDRIKNGKLIPNYITKSRYGNREWNAGVSPQTIKLLTGVSVVKEEMLSPAQAEKIGVPKDFVKQVTNQRFTGVKMERTDGAIVGNKAFGNNKPKMIGE